MRLLALTGVVLVALVGASTARADHLLPIPPDTASPIVRNVGSSGSPDYRITGATQGAIAVRAYDPLAAPWSPAGTNSIPATINKMQRRGRVLPALRVIGSIGMAASVGWAIGDTLGGTVYKLIAGSDPVGSFAGGYTVTPLWTFYANASPANGDFTFVDMWALNSQSTGLGQFGHHCTTTCEDWQDQLYGHFQSMIDVGMPHYSTHEQTVVTLTPCGSGAGAGEVCRNIYRTEEQMDDAREVTNTDLAGHNAADVQITNNYAAPGDLGTTADAQNAATALVAPDGTQTPGQQATEEAICEDLFPGECVRNDLIDLPAPQPNETYTAYIARLVALGHVGTITEVEETNVVAAYGPQAVTRVSIHVTPVRVLDPNNWPSTAPSVAPNVQLTIRYNPASATPVPTEGGTTTAPGTTTVTGVPTTIPSPPAVDFTPISDIEWGCKFPYGFLCYAVDFTEQFDVAADAPVFTFDMEMDVALGEFDLGTYEVDLEVMDAWMALWRDILSVVMVVGAIYFVATRMLGFKAGGDPGAAMDDVL